MLRVTVHPPGEGGIETGIYDPEYVTVTPQLTEGDVNVAPAATWEGFGLGGVTLPEFSIPWWVWALLAGVVVLAVSGHHGGGK